MDQDRLPTGFYVDAILKRCDLDFIPYYILQKGEGVSGVLLIKLDNLKGSCALRIQQRDFMTGKLGWVDALGKSEVSVGEADTYISRAKNTDPDLWVIEFESPDLTNPFEKEL